MENNQPRRNQAPVIPRSPHLIRSKSSTPSPLPENQTSTKSNSNPSKKSKTFKGVENLSNFLSISNNNKKKAAEKESKDDKLDRLLQRAESKLDVPRRTRSASTSPSAWALSAGRTSRGSSPIVPMSKLPRAISPRRSMSFSQVPVPKSPSSGKLKREMSKSGGNGVSGILKFLKQKRVSSAEEEEFHQFRVMHSRLMQWRYANARTEASMAVMKRVAQKKLFNVWVRISIIRNHIVEKQIQIQKLKHDIKLHQIFNSQFTLLKEWARLEGKNCEAVGRLARKLSALSTCLPLVHGAKADATSMYEAMSSAMRVLEGIKAMIANMQSQVEKACYMLTELLILLREQKEYVIELEKRVTMFSLLGVKEKSLKIHYIQLITDVVRSEGSIED